ncbi:SDR family NAD(P)-dependent oxidoreductase [Actinophytocola algeriensis]|uniref:3-oxoacyl-[acyl-carrier protein] reductase n=1 Tax=Actinophytocola algeriensis TaxID=1768010 RepID=A0A7W7Q674_9PSEU|nr:SDR family NAD(P)-dependent oxidoreductase [Actinophytocola algeriensis]MBB4907802.1 3-oxoacyl-[acyl-carrier protein] reductase [Actinophytocola algeriensis]MBE1479832.1 3-oxoacyl-[acyl-carrier protein] reductase [Actinophytocola algeriensis]
MGRTALVTGGASGIGQACAERLAEDGLSVVTADLAPGADLRLDVTSSAAVEEAAADLAVDVLVNSAGIIGPNKPFTEVADDEWAATFAVNVTGVFQMCRAFVPGMVARGWGRVVNVASIAGKEGNPNLAAYSASKAAVLGLTKSLGKELADSGVLVNAVAPAVIETPMNAATAPAVLERLVSLIPMRRMGTAHEVAELVAWLASDRCSFSTGAVYDISGGRATY